MMKKYILFVLSIIIVAQSFAQQETGRHKIALFLPLYLDSAFDNAGNYMFGKQFPKFLNPGLEFYEGVQLAVDSLQKTNMQLEVVVYDTRSSKSLYDLVQQPSFNNTELMIGVVSNAEIRPLADIAQKRKIPFINTNIPNNGGVTNNASLVILNSTLQTHCEGIYKFLQKNYATSRIVVFRQPGAQEDRLKTYFQNIEKSTASVPLKLKFVNLPENFTATQLIPHLDSTRQTMCVAGSLDEDFARALCTQLSSLNKKYPVQVMGMPTWDAIREIDRKDYKGLDILYSTPFYHSKTDRISQDIINHFKTNFFSRPSDMVFRGYEVILHFGKLLQELGSNIDSGIGEKRYKVFTDFDIQPIILNKQTLQLEYFENKKLYFIKKNEGVIKTVY